MVRRKLRHRRLNGLAQVPLAKRFVRLRVDILELKRTLVIIPLWSERREQNEGLRARLRSSFFARFDAIV